MSDLPRNGYYVVHYTVISDVVVDLSYNGTAKNPCSLRLLYYRGDLSLTFNFTINAYYVFSSKTIQYADRIFQVALPFMRGNPLCPTTALLKIIGIAGALPESRELFSYQFQISFTRVSRSNFRAKLRQWLPSFPIQYS